MMIDPEFHWTDREEMWEKVDPDAVWTGLIRRTLTTEITSYS